MALYQYVKASPVTIQYRERTPLVSLTFMALGAGILLWALWPIISFTIFTAPLFAGIVSPVADNLSGDGQQVLAAVTQGGTTSVDFTNPNVWFPGKPQKKIVTPVNIYRLSIPKLGINKALVMIAGDDLNKGLIHYGGTGLPGQYGTSVIFGHSVLPQFFKSTDYRTIFSTLPTLKVGDEFYIEYDGVTYTYKIHDMKITEPEDLSPLAQEFDDSHVTLITCVPPGLKTHRLNVQARLVRPETL